MNRSKGWLWLLVGMMLTVCVSVSALAEEAMEETGSVALCLLGTPCEVPYALLDGETEVASGMASTGTTVRLDDLPIGDDVLRIALPEQMRITQINGVDYALEGELSFSVPVKAGVVQRVDMVIAPQHEQYAAGIVLDENGTAVQGAKVCVTNAQGETVAEAQTDEQGAWITPWLPEGKYTVQADGASAPALEVTLCRDETAQVLFSAEKGQGTLSVTAFQDANNNAERDKYEQALDGVTVELLRVQNGTDMKVAEVDVTEDGKAVFEGLVSGEYRIRATLPRDYGFSRQSEKSLRETSNVMELDSALTQTSRIIEVTGGAVQTAVGGMPMSAVTGQVWLDSSADGVRDADEPGQAGVLIEAKGTKNGLIYQTVSGEDGRYELRQLRPGSYVVTYTLPEGYMFTRYASAGGSNRSIITESNTLVASKSFDLNKVREEGEQNVGVQKEGIIEVMCFLDSNANGVFDAGDLPLQGVKCEVRKRSNNEVVDTQESGEDGLAVFHTLRANTYKVGVTLPGSANFTQTAEDGNVFSAKNGKKDAQVTDIVLEASGKVMLQAGAVVLSSISGRVYMDDDFSGTMNGGEKAASGMDVLLQNENGETLATQRTDKNGAYAFEKLSPGYYCVAMQAKDGYAFTRLGEGNAMVNGGDGLGATDVFFLPMDTEMTGVDAGMIVPATVSGAVFVDDNDNGVRDAEENGLQSVVVSLEDAQSGTVFTAHPQEDGSFAFDAVMPGTYRVNYELPERGVFANGTALDDSTKTAWFTISSGENVRMEEVGVLQLPEMSGVIYDDTNANGAWDAGEMPLSGVQVSLKAENGAQESVAVISGEDGTFRIAGIRPGSYALQISFPEGYVMSRTGEKLTIPVQAGAAQSVAALTVSSGAMWEAQEVGAVCPATLRGRVWLDANNNGSLDEGDVYPAGEQVMVWDEDTQSVLTTLTTDASGTFATEGLIPGDYRLIYTPDEYTLLATGGDNTFRKAEDGTFVMTSLSAKAGETLTDASLGLMKYTSISGHVWVDMGGEVSVLEGVLVTLKNDRGQELATSTTDAEGAYQFKKLLPNDYLLTTDLPEGYVVVEQDDRRLSDGQLVSVMVECNRRHGESAPIKLIMGEDQTMMDIGAVLPGRLGDVCWLDENGNGLYDVGLEEGIPNLTITLMKDGEAVTETITDEYGFYCFRDLYPASYTLRVTLPDTIKPTTMRDDFAGIVSVLQESGESIPVEVVSQSGNYNADMGFVLTQKGIYPAGYGEGTKQIWQTEEE